MTKQDPWHSVDVEFPVREDGEVLVRGWGERKKHHVFDFARYEVKTACKQWIDRSGNVLWFEPDEWARLEQL